ncbi:MAG TPA: hypothetical protein VN624_02190 [Rhodanobacter sp.]|nr:hypothetical protein [Rhodanobacter sp.]
MSDKFFYGKGRVSLAELDASTGVPGAWRYIGDVSALSPKLTTEQVKHVESNSGQNIEVVNFDISKSMAIDATLHSLDADNLAMMLRGAVTTTAGGTASAESLGTTVAVGDEIYLANPGVSDLVITDSTGTPLTLTEGTDYDIDAAAGRVTIKNVGTYMQPFKAAYTYAARKTVSIFTTAQKYYALRYDGLDLANSNAPVRLDLYKVSAGVLQELAMISTGNDVAGMQVTFAALGDQSKSPTSGLGQFGSITRVG